MFVSYSKKNFNLVKNLCRFPISLFPNPVWDQKTTVNLPIKYIEQINHNTKIFTLDLLDSQNTLGINVGEHLVIRKYVEQDGQQVKLDRKYTPISSPDTKGICDILVKIYKPDIHPKFPLGGKLTPLLDQLQVGDTIEVGAPIGRLNYLGHGKFLFKAQKQEKIYKNIVMIAGGTGITPFFQIIYDIVNRNNDQTQVYLLYANNTKDDILLHEVLDFFNQNCKNIKVKYCLVQPPQKWNGYEGILNEKMIEDFVPKEVLNDCIGLTCGPQLMNQLVLDKFTQMGLSLDNVFKF